MTPTLIYLIKVKLKYVQMKTDIQKNGLKMFFLIIFLGNNRNFVHTKLFSKLNKKEQIIKTNEKPCLKRVKGPVIDIDPVCEIPI
jgi:hypothetical protein